MINQNVIELDKEAVDHIRATMCHLLKIKPAKLNQLVFQFGEDLAEARGLTCIMASAEFWEYYTTNFYSKCRQFIVDYPRFHKQLREKDMEKFIEKFFFIHSHERYPEVPAVLLMLKLVKQKQAANVS